jgi:hypothetical protein
MIHTVIWLSVLGVALLIPNVLALRLALGGAAQGGGTGRAAASVAAAPARPRLAIRAPRLLRRAYLWKALSPLLFGFSVVLGLGVGGTSGWVIMGVGLVNMLLGFWGWDEYLPGKAGKR